MACCSRKGLKICLLVTAILVIIVAVVIVALIFTVFKLRRPTITPLPVTLQKMDLVVFPVIQLKVSLGLVITIDNPNYGSFEHKNGTGYIIYRGNVVSEVPLKADTIPARAKHNVSATVDILPEKFLADEKFSGDVAAGIVNLSCETTLPGRVTVLKILKKTATSYCSCDVSLFLNNSTSQSKCRSNIKL